MKEKARKVFEAWKMSPEEIEDALKNSTDAELEQYVKEYEFEQRMKKPKARAEPKVKPKAKPQIKVQKSEPKPAPKKEFDPVAMAESFISQSIKPVRAEPKPEPTKEVEHSVKGSATVCYLLRLYDVDKTSAEFQATKDFFATLGIRWIEELDRFISSEDPFKLLEQARQ